MTQHIIGTNLWAAVVTYPQSPSPKPQMCYHLKIHWCGNPQAGAMQIPCKCLEKPVNE